MKLIPFIALFTICQINSTAAQNSIPDWLDTISPHIEIQPKKQYHNSPFFISFTSDKRSTIWFSVGSSHQMTQYTKPYTIAKDGTYSIYYYGVDDFGNKSKLDSVLYIFDSRSPSITVLPSQGIYPQKITITVKSDEPCSYFFQKTGSNEYIRFTDSLQVTERFDGMIIAEDRAGNRSQTTQLKYIVDTASFQITIRPAGGIFNRCIPVNFDASSDIAIYYSFDPLAPPEYFTKYEAPFILPQGLSILRYYGKRDNGRKSEIYKSRYIVDTIAPKLFLNVSSGPEEDTLYFSTREKTVIRYTKDKTIPDESSNTYTDKLIVPHKGITTIKARAWDNAGNKSDILLWEYKYDHTAPKISVSHTSGSYNRPQHVFFTTDEPTKIFYTLDGSAVTKKSLLYSSSGILISRNGSTVLRFFGVDEAGNSTQEMTVEFFLDTKPPEVKVRIDANWPDSSFLVHLNTNEPSTIYYSLDNRVPDTTSAVYTNPIRLKSGQVLQYFAVDESGNRSACKTIDDLYKPMVVAEPLGGVFNTNIKVSFNKNSDGIVFWRILPDTVFRKAEDFLQISNNGTHIFEYYFQNSAGIKSTVQRNVYIIDKISPMVQVALRKGNADSVIVFFESSEPSTIYYTIDGTDPLTSSSTRLAGNKFMQTGDRIVLQRSKDLKLAFFAEDAAGNQSSVSMLDLFRPRVVPSIPSGRDKVYDRVLSVTLNSFDQSTIYFERYGKTPSTASPVFADPLILMESDTILAFVIDASGYRGEIDTFVYLIDLPPSPQFTITPDTVYKDDEVIFDPAKSFDKESAYESLKYRWDFDGDGTFDSEFGKYARVKYQFKKSGLFKPKLEVLDGNNRKSVISKDVLVRVRCTAEMVSVIDTNGHAFCIDRYEWPNSAGVMPKTAVSWVEAKMICTDAGKRLCTKEEWVTACQGESRSVYPYGNQYNAQKCPTEGKKTWVSGSFQKCNQNGISDMLGNSWEWVETRDGDYRLMMGGSYKLGSEAHCGLKAEGTVATRSNETGFRCCK